MSSKARRELSLRQQWEIVLREDKTLNNALVTIGWALATWMSSEGECFPTVAQLILALRWKPTSKRNMFRYLAALERQGYLIRIRGRRGRATRYQATIPNNPFTVAVLDGHNPLTSPIGDRAASMSPTETAAQAEDSPGDMSLVTAEARSGAISGFQDHPLVVPEPASSGSRTTPRFQEVPKKHLDPWDDKPQDQDRTEAKDIPKSWNGTVREWFALHPDVREDWEPSR
jgi:hypothetical protein